MNSAQFGLILPKYRLFWADLALFWLILTHFGPFLGPHAKRKPNFSGWH